MALKLEKSIDFLILFIIFVKIIFVITTIGHLIITHTNKGNKYDPKLVFWRERTEFIFTICMAILLVYHFRPNHNKYVDHETALLFFLFGLILIITAEWNLFINEAPWFKMISSSITVPYRQ